MGKHKDIRPRVNCPNCKRSIATTGDATGARYLRPHASEPGKRCTWSGRNVWYLPPASPEGGEQRG